MESKKRVYKKYPYNSIASLARISEEQKKEVLSLYDLGYSQTKIGIDLKMTRRTIRTILKEGKVLRSRSKQQLIRRENTIDETVFDQITEESAYWLGFLYADGHIAKDNFSIQLTLKSSDLVHVEKIKYFFNTNSTISIRDNGKKSGRNKGDGLAAVIKVYSEILHKRLQEFGFDNQKSHTANPPEQLKFNRDFWRGVVDGDGCISQKANNPTVHLCGTKDTIDGFIDFVRQNNVETLARARHTTHERLYQVSFEYRKGRQVAELLYNNSNIYLDRKYKKVNDILKTKKTI